MPSPWDPLLVSPWEGEGDGSRERGHVVTFWGCCCDGVGSVGEDRSALLDRPVALTRGPPLNLPWEGRGGWLAGEGTCCCLRGYCYEERGRCCEGGAKFLAAVGWGLPGVDGVAF